MTHFLKDKFNPTPKFLQKFVSWLDTLKKIVSNIILQYYKYTQRI